MTHDFLEPPIPLLGVGGLDSPGAMQPKPNKCTCKLPERCSRRRPHSCLTAWRRIEWGLTVESMGHAKAEQQKSDVDGNSTPCISIDGHFWAPAKDSWLYCGCFTLFLWKMVPLLWVCQTCVLSWVHSYHPAWMIAVNLMDGINSSDRPPRDRYTVNPSAQTNGQSPGKKMIEHVIW